MASALSQLNSFKQWPRLERMIGAAYINWEITDSEVEMQSRKIAQLAAEIEKLRTFVSCSSGTIAGLTLGLAARASGKGLLLCGVGGALIGMAAATAFEYLRKAEGSPL